MPPALSTLVILEIGSCFLPGPAWMGILLFMLLTMAVMTVVHHYDQLFLIKWGLRNFSAHAGLDTPNLSLQCGWGERCAPVHLAIESDEICAWTGLELLSSQFQAPK
jgi:hypothetical protein